MAACKPKGKPKFADGGLAKKEKNELPKGRSLPVTVKKYGMEDKLKSMKLDSNNNAMENDVNTPKHVLDYYEKNNIAYPNSGRGTIVRAAKKIKDVEKTRKIKGGSTRGKPKFADGGLVNKGPDPKKDSLPVKVIDKDTGKEDTRKSDRLEVNNFFARTGTDRLRSFSPSKNARMSKEVNRDEYKYSSSQSKKPKDSAASNSASKGHAVAFKAANKVIDRQSMPKGGRGVRGKGK